VERVLDSLGQSLDQFDRAVEQGSEGRRVHIGAGANLDVAADEIVQIVKVIDGRSGHAVTRRRREVSRMMVRLPQAEQKTNRRRESRISAAVSSLRLRFRSSWQPPERCPPGG
jgi:hypothetical protein